MALAFLRASNIKPIVVALVVGLFALARSASVSAQDQPVKVKGGHEVGETAERFFSEGHEKGVLADCAAGNFKSLDRTTRKEAKYFCSMLADIRRMAMSGSRTQYESGGDPAELREDTFTFDGGRLVKVQLQYGVPGLESNNRGLSFEQILAGVKQGYGPPTRESAEQVRNIYGVSYTTHSELWLRSDAAISITQRIAGPAATTVTVCTRDEYDRSVLPGALTPDPLR